MKYCATRREQATSPRGEVKTDRGLGDIRGPVREKAVNKHGPNRTTNREAVSCGVSHKGQLWLQEEGKGQERERDNEHVDRRCAAVRTGRSGML